MSSVSGLRGHNALVFSGCFPYFHKLQPKHPASLKPGLVPGCSWEWLPFTVRGCNINQASSTVFSVGISRGCGGCFKESCHKRNP